jgi:hypothetical protein
MFSHLTREAVAERVSAGKVDFLNLVTLVAFMFALDILVVVANDGILLVRIPVMPEAGQVVLSCMIGDKINLSVLNFVCVSG